MDYRDRLGTILCLGAASLGSTQSPGSATELAGIRTVLAMVQAALLRLSWVHKAEQGSSVWSVTALLGDV